MKWQIIGRPYALLYKRSTMPHKVYKGLANGDAVVFQRGPLDAAVVDIVGEDASSVSPLEDLGDDVLCELWVTLDGDVLAG